ncbi:DNA cytosine methyltransferase [Novosphingobium colocasiae]|uniref:DNA cytosine methyltransferase n=1 Tax=Novosphingobium colocasiae TaxID=1256513 RepID=UPI0016785BAA
MWAYYNEPDPEKAHALRALMADGWIAPGEVDERDIRDVVPAELSGFAQCHFFAGIGLWSVAARAAGIPDDFPFWSGSCPCQPFSTAGAGEGFADPRHLWPHWYWLIAVCGPHAVVGEQVADNDGLAWLDLVSADMEGSLYAGGALDLCSAGLGAPNIRQRLYMLWLVHSERAGLERHAGNGDDRHQPGWFGARQNRPVAPAGPTGRVARSDRDGRQPGRIPVRQRRPHPPAPVECGYGEGGDAGTSAGAVRHPLRGPTNGFWAGADWLLCRDPDGPKLRPVEPGAFCLAAGYPGRTGALRGYGDAINLQVATAFLQAVWPEMRAAS